MRYLRPIPASPQSSGWINMLGSFFMLLLKRRSSGFISSGEKPAMPTKLTRVGYAQDHFFIKGAFSNSPTPAGPLWRKYSIPAFMRC
jgi:hypothetical protein